MSDLPMGSVTFLFTDIEGSTRLWEEHPEAMQGALARHDELVRAAIVANEGHVVKTAGDGFHAVFSSAHYALAAAIAAQRALESEPWTIPTVALRARMGLHTGEAERREGDYYGTTLNRAARLMSAGHGGQVLVSAATHAVVGDRLPDGCSLVDLGEYRLRDLGRAQRIYQLVHPDLPRDFAPLRTLDAFPGNLPLQVSSLVGREEELERVAHALTTSPVVTLTGVGGVGKTRLAYQVAAEVLPHHRDGAWVCELQMVRDPGGVVDAVAGVFRVSARPGMTLEESLVAYFRGQELLLVLDNCEHLLRPVASLVSGIIAECPQIRVLATSREGLNVRGEQILVVPSLGVPDEGIDLDALAECEAVRLFVERARAAKDGFVVDAANADAVSQLCRRLDGVPLAIELAAARVTAMSPSELVRRLDRRFRLLTGGDRVAIERHQTLRATIDWSYDLLDEAQQRLLARLAVFAGGCTLDAAESVCGTAPIDRDDVFDLLSDLVARSLVVADDSGLEMRYRLLETIRQYSEERLGEAGETDALRRRHAEFYTALAAEAFANFGGPGVVEWGARVAREHDNLQVAMANLIEARDVDAAFALLLAMPTTSGQINDVVVYDVDPLLALPGAAEHPGSAVALAYRAARAWQAGQGELGLSLADQAIAAQQRLGRPAGSAFGVEIMVAGTRAQIALVKGETADAVALFREAADHADGTPFPALRATNLATAAITLSWVDPDASRALATDGLTIARRTGQPSSIVWNLVALSLALARSDPDAARAMLHEASDMSVTLGYESPTEYAGTIIASALLDEWSLVPRAASRLLHHALRNGNQDVASLAACLNAVARALADDEPETAAIVQGTVTAVLRPAATDIEAGVSGRTAVQGIAPFFADVRRDASTRLRAQLGEERLRELRARGAAMDQTQACAYVRAEIDRYLARKGVAASRAVERSVPDRR